MIITTVFRKYVIFCKSSLLIAVCVVQNLQDYFSDFGKL